jgi:steroid 5-alpha reductase family enzyme
MQWLAFVPAYLKQTEAFYDLTGSLTFICCTLLALVLSAQFDLRSVLLAIFITVWAARLGSFLFLRIHQDGSDDRFDRIKPDSMRFFMTWSLQGLWVLLTAGAALAAITSTEHVALSATDLLGAALWLAGFAIEVIADRQKREFRRSSGRGQFITTGLWSRSRHPNYFGEIVLWLGVALLALPALSGWQLVTMISPVFVFVLLTKISGIPLLERKADRKWGGQPMYESYKAKTPVLFPRLL